MAALRSVKIPKHLESSGIFQLHLRAKATLGSAAAKDAVKLPPGVDKNMWIAAQGLEVFEEAASLVDVLCPDICNEGTCPAMRAGKHFTYLWVSEGGRKEEVSAAEYMRRVVIQGQHIFEDGEVVPHGDGLPFPPAPYSESYY
mmetsp:Transcript_6310/g.8732  ORF Transcript_6310/g.8732 Transcript_6310/m.8732 type:complete len:143 (-) Transcript_6310:22-450(-)